MKHFNLSFYALFFALLLNSLFLASAKAQTSVSTVTQWNTAWANNTVTSIRLDADITLTTSQTLSARDVTIDLNDNDISMRGMVIGAGLTLTIEDNSAGASGVFNSTGEEDFAGIQTSGANLIINSGSINATGGYASAGIGGGVLGANGSVTIHDGTVTALGGGGGAGIGGGFQGTGGTVVIHNGEVTASGGSGSAGIGGGLFAGGGSVTIHDGNVTATGRAWGASSTHGGAGIGSGWDGISAGTVVINGGVVTATGASAAAGIGAHGVDTGANVTLAGNAVVSATGLNGGAPVGSGVYGTFGSLAINDNSTLLIGSNWTIPNVTITGTGRIDSISGAARTIINNGVVVPPIDDTRLLPTAGAITVSSVAYAVDFVVPWDTSQNTRVMVYAPDMATGGRSLPIFTGKTYTLNTAQNGTGTTFTTATPLSADLTVYAVYDNTVSFVMNGHGTALPAQTVTSGNTVTEPSTPTATGYTFGGWFSDTTLLTPYNFSNTVFTDLTLYASWSVSTYTIGGTVSGLETGNSVVLQNNGGDDITITADSAFTFATTITHGDTYDVSILTPPDRQTCTLANNSGTATANINTIIVHCNPIPVPTLPLQGLLLLIATVIGITRRKFQQS